MANEKITPTAAELEILQLLWQHGPLTVRRVCDALNEDRKLGYTTVLKTMQIMHDKGMLGRELDGKRHIYHAKIAETDTQDRLLDVFLQRTFGGSTKRLVMRALGNYKTSSADLEDLKRLIDGLEQEEE